MSLGQKRRNYFIDKNFQSKFILRFCLIVVMSTILTSWLLLHFSSNSNTVAIENTKVIVKSTRDFILPIIIHTVIVVSCFTAMAVAALTLLMSHKISGPLFRLTKEIDALENGDLGRTFTVRGEDQLQNLAKSLRKMNSSLNSHYAELKEKFSSLEQYLEEKKFIISAKDKDFIVNTIDEIKRKLDDFKA